MKFTPRQIESMSAYWQVCAPFFAEFLLRFTYIQSDSIPTMGVSFQNKALTLTYNEQFLNSLTKEELEGVLAHEIMHVLYNHSIRFFGMTESLKNTEQEHTSHEIYNYAADTVINEMILKDLTVNGRSLALPKNCWTLDHKLLKEYKGLRLTESVYMYLYDKIPKVTLKVNAQGDVSKESGGGGGQDNKSDNGDGDGDSGGSGESYEVTVFDVHNKLDDLSNHEAQEMIELIKYTAEIKGWGTLAGKGLDTIKELLRPKKVPIQKMLRAVLQSSADGYLIKFDTYCKSNRRGYDLLPGKKKKGAVINMVVDTSGSCFSDETFSLFFSEVDYLANRVKDINLIQVDTIVQDMRKYTKGFWKKIKMVGCGGTEFQPLFDFLVAKKLDRYPTIIFTDGYFDWNINSYGIKPLWVLDNKDAMSSVKFGSSFCLVE